MKRPGSQIPSDKLDKLLSLEAHAGSTSLKDLSRDMGLSPQETMDFLRQTQHMLSLTPDEWMALEELLSNDITGSLRTLKQKITENSRVKAVMDLLNQLENWDQELSLEMQSFVTQLDQAVEQKKQVMLTTKSQKNYQVFPCKIIHLEGKLSMIGEDALDHCLVVVTLDELRAVEPVMSTSTSKVAPFEIEEFIVAIRSMSEKETRLILKIHDPQSVNLFPEHHFLGKPCMITNSNGDLIWAAHVEPCEDLFEWLLSLESKVEVLDPGKFKDEFLAYCEEKLRKVA